MYESDSDFATSSDESDRTIIPRGSEPMNKKLKRSLRLSPENDNTTNN